MVGTGAAPAPMRRNKQEGPAQETVDELM